MTLRQGLAAIILACTLVAGGSMAHAQEKKSNSGLIYAESDDMELKAATEAARDSLPTFLSRFDNQRPDDGPFLLKVGLPTTDDSLEHIWMLVESHKGGNISGKLVNVPVDIEGMSKGSKVTVTVKQVTDWTYFRGGRGYGQFTTRVFAKRMTVEERAVFDDLWPTPIEVEKP